MEGQSHTHIVALSRSAYQLHLTRPLYLPYILQSVFSTIYGDNIAWTVIWNDSDDFYIHDVLFASSQPRDVQLLANGAIYACLIELATWAS